jgi:hypothetical protein
MILVTFTAIVIALTLALVLSANAQVSNRR